MFDFITLKESGSVFLYLAFRKCRGKKRFDFLKKKIIRLITLFSIREKEKCKAPIHSLLCEKRQPCVFLISCQKRSKGHEETNKQGTSHTGLFEILTIKVGIGVKNNSSVVLRFGKSILEVPDTGTWVLDNTRPFLHSSIVSFWITPACSKERKHHIFRQYWYTRNVPVFTNTGTFQYLGPEVYFFLRFFFFFFYIS